MNDLKKILAHLTTDQIRYVVARQEHDKIKDAAKACHLSPSTVYHWPPIVEEAAKLFALDGLTTAMHLRRRALTKAMLVKIDGLESRDEKVRQAAATEIIEWELGKALQRGEISGPEGRDLLPLPDLVALLQQADDWLGEQTGDQG